MCRNPLLHRVALLLVVAACAQNATAQRPRAGECTIPGSLLNSGVGKDAIPSLQKPAVVSGAGADLQWPPQTRVLGVEAGGVARAYPLPILWWHEIVNDQLGDAPVAVTYCPLTGTGLVFEPLVDGVYVNFGTSGLIYDNNLVMYDRSKKHTSLWPQLDETAVCDTPSVGQHLQKLPVVETSWAMWRQMHPDSTIVSRDTGHDRDYDQYPYGDYDEIGNTLLLYPQSFVDGRLPLKALVYGVRHEGATRAYAYSSLDARGDQVVVNHTLRGLRMAIVWDAATRTVLAFDRRPRVQRHNGKWKNKTLRLELVPGGDGLPFVLRDKRSGTTFALDGTVLEGPLADRIENGRLEPLSQGYTAFWFAWAAFHRDTDLF